mgnify:CR=1 FL=1
MSRALDDAYTLARMSEDWQHYNHQWVPDALDRLIARRLVATQQDAHPVQPTERASSHTQYRLTAAGIAERERMEVPL